jgi:hypothetical protein
LKWRPVLGASAPQGRGTDPRQRSAACAQWSAFEKCRARLSAASELQLRDVLYQMARIIGRARREKLAIAITLTIIF